MCQNFKNLGNHLDLIHADKKLKLWPYVGYLGNWQLSWWVWNGQWPGSRSVCGSIVLLKHYKWSSLGKLMRFEWGKEICCSQNIQISQIWGMMVFFDVIKFWNFETSLGQVLKNLKAEYILTEPIILGACSNGLGISGSDYKIWS